MSAVHQAQGSIQRRLIVRLLGGVAGLSLVLFLLVQGFARQLAEESQDNILAASVAAILDAAAFENGALALDLPYSAFSMLANAEDDAVFYAVYADDAFQTGYAELPRVASGSRDALGFGTVSYRGEPVRLASGERSIASGDGLIRLTATVGQTLLGQETTLARASRYAVGLGLGFFLVAALLALVSARSAIAPLERLAQSVARRGPGDLRPVEAPVPSEMGPLVRALNRFIERLGVSLARSEDFIAEAAHRVRTPLATVRMQAEVTLTRVEKEENRTSLREMIRAIDESSRAAGQLLDHAMVTFRTDHLEEEEIDLSQLVLEVTERLRPTADLRDIVLEARIDAPARITGDAILVQNALRNLVDNAIKYSTVEGRVVVWSGVSDGFARIQVEDEGIGFSDADLADVMQRFVRGSNVEGVVGSGLGLTIADEVARAHDGHLNLRNRQEGTGACVELYLPLA